MNWCVLGVGGKGKGVYSNRICTKTKTIKVGGGGIRTGALELISGPVCRRFNLLSEGSQKGSPAGRGDKDPRFIQQPFYPVQRRVLSPLMFT